MMMTFKIFQRDVVDASISIYLALSLALLSGGVLEYRFNAQFHL